MRIFNLQTSLRGPAIRLMLASLFFACPIMLGANDLYGAQEESAPVVAPSDSEEASVAELNQADVAWMMMSSALVLFMTAPGLAMFYSGLVRRKNVVGVIMQCLFLMGLMSVVWALWGFSFAFGGEGTFCGNFEYICLTGIQMNNGTLPVYPGKNIPTLLFMIFQGMFFIITPALICGAFAERMKFSAMVLFMVLWGTIVYCPLCHMVWGGGWLAEGGLAGGALDFAGGTVVHISSGVAALVCAMFIGKRAGYGDRDMRPHNLTYTALGAAMLWFGWFGFNAGSAGSSGNLAVNAFVVTHLAAAAGAVTWAAIEWIFRKKPSVLGTASGAIAGLVAITPAAGFVQPMPALAFGVLGAIGCYLACGSLKHMIGYDDSLDAFGIHGIGGMIGAVLTGVFASEHVGGTNGILYGGDFQLIIGQVAAVLVTIVFSAVVSYVLLLILDRIIGVRVNQVDEQAGLDIAIHGEEGYLM